MIRQWLKALLSKVALLLVYAFGGHAEQIPLARGVCLEPWSGVSVSRFGAEDFAYGDVSLAVSDPKPIQFYVGNFPDTTNITYEADSHIRFDWGSQVVRREIAPEQVAYVVLLSRSAGDERLLLFAEFLVDRGDAKRESMAMTLAGTIGLCKGWKVTENGAARVPALQDFE